MRSRIKIGNRILGEGGYGKVYLGTYVKNAKTGEKIESAIKVVPATRMDIAEYMLHSKLSKTPKCHQHIVCMYDLKFDKSKDTYFIAMEYVKGKDLFHDLLATDHHPTPDQLFQIFKDILDGLVYIHESGMAHGDIKLENLMMDEKTGNIKYIDFGFGCTKETCSSSRVFHGTRYLSPPEATKAAKNLQSLQAADVWAVGSTLAEILMHRRTIDVQLSGTNVTKTTDVIAKVKKYAPGHLPVMYEVIKGMMEYDPKKRLTAKQALAMLEK